MSPARTDEDIIGVILFQFTVFANQFHAFTYRIIKQFFDILYFDFKKAVLPCQGIFYIRRVFIKQFCGNIQGKLSGSQYFLDFADIYKVIR
ncbi:hypothetical protein DS62_01085 [Smithella sp. SC_K08D17]|nr:hypothetical protein DS62_01085 [Smithella sp. SC_K08D17]